MNDDVYIERLGSLPEGIEVWLVDGRAVRHDFIDFVEGGHDLVYDWIPERQIWIDNDLSRDEWPFVIVHEAIERALMEDGMEYDPAHDEANKVEDKLRHEPGDIDPAHLERLVPVHVARIRASFTRRNR